MTTPATLGVVIVAAGSGVRFGDAGKALASLAGRPLLSWSLALFDSLPETHEIVVVAGSHTLDSCTALLTTASLAHVTVVEGGATRTASMLAGLAALSDQVSHVAVHDAARPLVTVALAQRVIAAAVATGAAVPVIPVRDTLHVVSAEGRIAATPDRATLRAAQTPQVARRDWLLAAGRSAAGSTDEGGMLHAAGYPVALVEGDPDNLKITWPQDLALAEALLAARKVAR
ncbi:MAG TPA: 2-C-methyl-D-erythritol 4-phosphate cytidylyltransferase [Thermomicrobiales bacterium]|nr:2-C-methyl-D-erythritol 4-phosphate cytidylyltransferase [Thermomicrobiales bacterium]